MKDPASVATDQIVIPTIITYFRLYRSPIYPKMGAKIMKLTMKAVCIRPAWLLLISNSACTSSKMPVKEN